MRVDWCVSSWFRIKNTHSLTGRLLVALVESVLRPGGLREDVSSDVSLCRSTFTPVLITSTLEGWHRERQEGVRTASRSSDRRARTLDVGERMAHALDGGEAKNTGSGRPLA